MDKQSEYWQKEWSIKRRNKRIMIAAVALIVAIIVFVAIYYASIHATRTTFGSKEEMQEYVQGRWTSPVYNEEYLFDGKNVQHIIHDVDGNEEYDHINEDVVVKWKYLIGEIDFDYMSPLVISKDGLLEDKEHPDWLHLAKDEG